MYSGLFEGIKELILNDWRLKGENLDENSNRRDLSDFLSYKLSQKKISLRLGIKEKLKIELGKESGVLDIVVDGKMLICIKENLNNLNYVDTLISQVKEHSRGHKYILVVLVGETDKKALCLLEDKINELMRSSIFMQSRIEVINRGQEPAVKKNEEEDRDKLGERFSYYGG